ncbi:MAG: hypothetical protein Q4A78_12735 [Peptostreptococcaceae bacterium]|nr:hypothetical protein [Peptostreptococcaceae bacterium]
MKRHSFDKMAGLAGGAKEKRICGDPQEEKEEAATRKAGDDSAFFRDGCRP